jgi:hypothetical protein
MQNFLNKEKYFIVTIAALFFIWNIATRNQFISLIPFLVVFPLVSVMICLLKEWIFNIKNPGNPYFHKTILEFPAAYFAAAFLLFSFVSPLENSSSPLYNLGSLIFLSSILLAFLSLLWMYSKGIYVAVKHHSDLKRKIYGQNLLFYAWLDTVVILSIIFLFGLLLTPA